jgi:myo-inositol 2-dehydrogenase/D-chiro-inositol 1-dehydrogenase/scyllo-inositol 2-dehydrogenase (NAD+)
VDVRIDRAGEVARQLQPRQSSRIQTFASAGELVASGICQAAIIASSTAQHREHAQALVNAGRRVLIEKPLTGSLADDRQFTAFLNQHHPHALMLAFQRRFDAPLVFAKQLLNEGAIGTPFKFVSILEDSRPPPDGYDSPGLLPDMSVHNIDEVLWLSGERPVAATALAARLYNHKVASINEDFDDVLLQLWFPSDRVAQIQVSRNHVSGYRTETWIFGENGVIHVGQFEQNRFAIVVEAYGRTRPITRREFSLREYQEDVPEFIERFGPAYKGELAHFVAQCIHDQPFCVDQNDGLVAMEVVAAGQRSVVTKQQGVRVEYS